MTFTPADPTQPTPVQHLAAGAPEQDPTEEAEETPVGTGYQTIPGVRWQPIYTATQVKTQVWTWSIIGWGLAAVTILIAALVAETAAADDGPNAVGIVAVAGAVAGGLLLVCTGIGLLHAESLRARAVRVRVNNDAGTEGLRGIADLDNAFPAKEFGQALGGLTAARALVFAGAFLLSVAAVAGAVGLSGEDGDDAPVSTPTPTGTAPAESTA